MGKIVKHCAACEESFAQKFGFCPNCGGVLEAFEMNPVQQETKAAATDKPTETTTVSQSPVSELPKANSPITNDFVAPSTPSTKIYETSSNTQQPAVVPAAPVFSANDRSSNGTTSEVNPRLEKVVSG
jgi:hypothetical protein